MRAIYHTIFSLLLILVAILMASSQAAAQDCTGPNGDHGVISYNEDYGVIQGCTPQGWVAMSPVVCPLGDGCNPAPADPCDPAESPTPGTICADGTIYAGTTVGGVPMYAARCDHGQSWDGAACTGAAILRQWKATQTTTVGTASLTDGVVNTDAMATAGLPLHPAAEACRNLGAEWYLPAQDELNVLWVNRVAIGGFNTTGFPAGWYWSSSETNVNNARLQRFNDGTQPSFFTKSTEVAVRCVRR